MASSVCSGFLQKPADMYCKLHVRPGARIHKMETKIDNLAEKISKLTLLMKKRHDAPSSQVQEKAKETFGPTEGTCFYCRRPGYGAGRCPDKRNRDKRCLKCGKWSHGKETCGSMSKVGKAAKAAGKANQGHIAVICSNVTAESTDTDSTEN